MHEALPGVDGFDDDGAVDSRIAKQLSDCRIFGMHKKRETEATGQKNEFGHCVSVEGLLKKQEF